MTIEIYAMESAVLRTQKMVNKKARPRILAIAMTRVYLTQSLEKVEAAAKKDHCRRSRRRHAAHAVGHRAPVAASANLSTPTHCAEQIVVYRLIRHIAHNLHLKGQPFHITLNVSVPGTELVVKRDPKDAHINEDIFVALRDAFDSMSRQLKDYASRSRGEVKARAAQ